MDKKRIDILKDLDDLNDHTKMLRNRIYAGYKQALKEGISANTVILNKKFAKVNPIDVYYYGNVMRIPPMIAGLEAVASDEMPDNVSFLILEADRNSTDRFVRVIEDRTIKEFIKRFESHLANATFTMGQINAIHCALKKATDEMVGEDHEQAD